MSIRILGTSKIEIKGTFDNYCKDCPNVELEEIASSLETGKIYACANRCLCSQLWQHLKSIGSDDR